jgi:lysophospholipase L1-like esterase
MRKIAKRLWKTFLTLSVVLTLALGALAVMAYVAPVNFFAIVSQQLAGLFMEPYYERRVANYDTFPPRAGGIVFVGDSITEGGHWHDMFPEQQITNFGVGGDTTRGVLGRLHQVTRLRPESAFLLIGTNDLGMGVSLGKIEANYDAILRQFRAESPGTVVYVQSVLPRSRPYAKHVQELNNVIRGLAEQHGVTYVDLYPHFARDDGSLDPSFSNDALHLSGVGYARWQTLIQPFVVGD